MVAPVAEVTEQHLVLVRRVLDILQYLALVRPGQHTIYCPRRLGPKYQQNLVLVGWVLQVLG